jgi:hypothetical protein
MFAPGKPLQLSLFLGKARSVRFTWVDSHTLD